MKKEFKGFFESVQGTFLEEVLAMPDLQNSMKIGGTDVVIAVANDFEKKCFNFYFFSVNPSKFGLNRDCEKDMIRLSMRGHSVLGLVRSLIADRYNVSNTNIDRIWLSADGHIFLRNPTVQ